MTPPAVADAIPRPRLVERLDAALERPVVWLQGPPGAGKTTLVARFLMDKGIEPIWYRVDCSDTDPATFFFYNVCAVARVSPETAGRLPEVEPAYLRELAAFGRRFFRALFDRPGQSVVVFDDYHELDAGSILHACLAEALREIPDNARVMILSRTPPPKEFAWLRMHGAIDVVAPQLLRLDLAEAGLLAQARSVEVAPAAIARLVQQMDGWAAGLIIMMDAAQSDSTVFADQKEAVPQLVFDYFAGEVFQRMETRSQRILTTLADLPSMTSAAARMLTEDDGAVGLLEDLASRNYFTIREAAVDAHFRFHPLFRQFLQTQACAIFDETERAQLRLRAAHALEQSGQIEPAIVLFCDAAAWDDLARIIRASADSLCGSGRHASLKSWLALLPSERVVADGWLAYWDAMTCLSCSPAQSRSLFRRTLALFEIAQDIDGIFLAWAGLASSIIEDPSSNQADLDGDIRLLRKLLKRFPSFPSSQVEFRVSLVMFLALNRRSADRTEILLWRDRAMTAAASVGAPGLVVSIRHKIAIYALFDGDFATFREQIDGLPAARDLNEAPLLQASAYLMEGLAQLFGQLPGRCDNTAEKAFAASKESGIYLWTHFQAGLEVFTGNDLGRSRKWLRQTAELAGKIAVYHGAHYQMLAANIALLTGDSDAAIRSGQHAVAMTVADGWFLYEAMARVTLAQALDGAGRFADADAELDAAEQAAARVALSSLKVSTDFLHADFLLQRGRDAEGLRALAEAMERAERAGARRTMLAPVRNSRLYARAIIEGLRPKYACLLIKESTLPPPDDRSIDCWPWPLKITTLGGFDILKEGEPLELSRKTPKRLFTLLKAIIAFGATNVSEIKIIDAVWPDEDGDAGHRAFNIAIHRLRKLIDDDRAIVLKDGRVSLDPARWWLDVWAFEEGLARKDGCLPNARVLALYKGAFLADDDLPWAEPIRRKLAARFAQAVSSTRETTAGPALPQSLVDRSKDR